MSALHGMTVVDLTQQLPGPFATALLVTLGARVMKVEPPGGEPARTLDPAMFDRVNTGKETVFLDLKTDEGRGALDALVAQADVLVESFRPGVADRIGAGWQRCRAVNPQLVHCSISGFGPAGAYAQVPVHDLNLLAWGDPESARRSSGRIGVPWVDLGTGATAALAIVAAWHEAVREGRGQHVDVSMQDVALGWAAVKPVATGPEPTYSVYRTRDHREVVIAVLEDHFWQRLCRALRLDEFGTSPELATYQGRRARAAEVDARVAEAVARLSLDDVLSRAAAYDLPITTVDPADDPRALAHLAANGVRPGGLRAPSGPAD